MIKRRILHLFLICSYFLYAIPLAAQTTQSYHLPKDAMNKGVFITENWVYKGGDNPYWANPEFDDTDWQPVDTLLPSKQLSGMGWKGVGWFRLHLVIDPVLVDRSLGLAMNHTGDYQIYLNGELIYRLIEPVAQRPEDMSWKSGPRPIVFHEKVDHVIAVRYSNPDIERVTMAGFVLYLGDLVYMMEWHTNNTAKLRSVQGIFSARPFAFGILHLLLFLFFRRAVGNLYFAISMFLIAGATFIDYQSSLAAYSEQSQLYLRIHRGILTLLFISIFRFMYSLFYKKLPLQFWILSAATIITGVSAVYSPDKNLFFLNIVFILIILEMLRVNILAVHKKSDGAWIILVGFILQIIFSFYDIFLDFGVLTPVRGIQNAYFIGTFGLIVCMSVYLARDFAKTRRNLEIYSEELKESNAKLEEYSHTLEEKVTERTRSLSERNADLQTTLRKLTETQAQLIQSGKMAALGNLVAGIAHEVNNPVSAVAGASDVLDRGLAKVNGILQNIQSTEELKGNQKLHETLSLLSRNNQAILAGSQRVAEIVQKLRDFSRLDEADFQKVDIHKGLDSTLTLIHHELGNNIEVRKEYGKLPSISCYPNELNQVFMNVLVNSAQAIEGQGIITIKTLRDEKNVCVQIIDTGKGIAAENLGKIFDPSFTTKGHNIGLGLGLSISRNIIDKHNGDIRVDSEIGKGTTVTITLPLK